MSLSSSTHKHRKLSDEQSQTPETAKGPYTPPSLYAVSIKEIFARNQIHEIHRAAELFAQKHVLERSLECADLCHQIISKNPSEAVMAKAHMMLVTLTDSVEPVMGEGKA